MTASRACLGALALAALLAPLSAGASTPDSGPLCGAAWYRLVEQRVATGDGRGHGPDPGSDEWRSAVEFRLGIRGQPGVPPRAGEAWCRHVDGLLWPEPRDLRDGR